MRFRRSLLAAVALSGFLLGCGEHDSESQNQVIIYQAYAVEPAFLGSSDAEQGSAADLFPAKHQTIHEFLAEIGIDFSAPDSAVITGLGFPGFGMRNTTTNHQILARALDERFPGKWSIVEGKPAS